MPKTTIATLAAAEAARVPDLEARAAEAERTGRYARFDEYSADVNEHRSNDLDTALSIAGDAGKLLAVLGNGDVAETVGPALNCGEANRVASALHLLGQTAAAVGLLEQHATDDDEGDEHRDMHAYRHSAIVAYVTALEIDPETE